ncbi:MAG: hypothetical protein U1U88_000342 [Lawsonella clevelandensis]
MTWSAMSKRSSWTSAVTAPAAGTIHYVIDEDFVDVDGGDDLAELR